MNKKYIVSLSVSEASSVKLPELGDDGVLPTSDLSFAQLTEVASTIGRFGMRQSEAFEALSRSVSGSASDFMEVLEHVSRGNFVALHRNAYGEDFDVALGRYIVFDLYPLETEETILGSDIQTFLDFEAIGRAARCYTSLATYSHTTETHHYFIK